MKNIWLLFKNDVKRAFQNTIMIVIMFGLVIMPSLFTWFNVEACWDVFSNTGNLKVAVANTDEGYKSDLIPIGINIGEQVISELRANDQLNWVFTDEEDAIDGTRSGKYYAAVIIPPTFSQDMITFYSSDSQHATITYYSNAKKNAISPKVTDQGADKVSAEVNKVFVETLSEIGLGLSSSFLSYSDDTGFNASLVNVVYRMDAAAGLMDNTAKTLDSYAQILGIAQNLLNDSAKLIEQAGTSVQEVATTVQKTKGTIDSVSGAIDATLASLDVALGKSAESFSSVSMSIENVFSTTDKQAKDTVSELRVIADSVDNQVEDYEALVLVLEDMMDTLPPSAQESVRNLINRINSTIPLLENLRDALYAAADDIDSGNVNTQEAIEEIRALAVQAQTNINNLHIEYNTNIKPDLSSLSGTIGNAYTIVSQIDSDMQSIGTKLTGTSQSVATTLGDTRTLLADASKDLKSAAQELRNLGQKINGALATGDTKALREVIGADPAVMATALSAPVTLDRQAVYPIENFGSAMSPLYTTLALWIGVLIVMVTVKVLPSRQILKTLDHPTPLQTFIGRFGIIALLAFLQSTVMCLGNMLFLQVQVENPLLYLICFWVSSLVFAFIVYTLVATFANLGKALGVFLLILQVSGGGGSYPLALLPDFVQIISPYLPITHAVNAMRAAMFGVYGGDFWIEIGCLLLFTVPCIFIGCVVRKPLMRVVNHFVEKVESTKIM